MIFEVGVSSWLFRRLFSKLEYLIFVVVDVKYTFESCVLPAKTFPLAITSNETHRILSHCAQKIWENWQASWPTRVTMVRYSMCNGGRRGGSIVCSFIHYYQSCGTHLDGSWPWRDPSVGVVSTSGVVVTACETLQSNVLAACHFLLPLVS